MGTTWWLTVVNSREAKLQALMFFQWSGLQGRQEQQSLSDEKEALEEGQRNADVGSGVAISLGLSRLNNNLKKKTQRKSREYVLWLVVLNLFFHLTILDGWLIG